MASISTNKSGGIIRFDSADWQGLVPQYANSATNTVTAQRGLAFSRCIDPQRIPGFLVPGPNPTDVTNVSAIDASVRSGATNGSKAYLTSAGPKLHELDLTNDTVTNAGSWPHTTSAHGGHSSVVLDDTIKYRIGATEYLFYSWSDSNDGDIGRYDLSSTFDDDWLSTVPSGNAVLDTTHPHPFGLSKDLLYIGDGRNLHVFDGQSGAAGTLTKSIFQVPSQYVITSIVETENYLVIYAYLPSSSGSTFYKSEAKAFFWDYISADPTFIYDLNGNYVNGGFLYNGVPGCFVQGNSSSLYANKLSKMLLFNGSEFKPVQTFFENIPYHGGVQAIDDIVYFNAGGTIYSYGSQHVGLDKQFNKLTEGLGTTSSGILANFGGNSLYISTGTTTAGGLQVVSGRYHSQASFSLPSARPSFPQGFRGQAKVVKIYWGQASSGANLFSLSLRTDFATTTTVVSNLAAVTTLTTEHFYSSSTGALPNFNALGLVGSYSGVDTTKVPPYIEAVEVYYDYIKL